MLHHSAAVFKVPAMPNSANTNGHVRPGPKPQFPYRMEMRLRNDQRQALVRIAATLNVGVSDVIRWFIDEGIERIESNPAYIAFKGKET